MGPRGEAQHQGGRWYGGSGAPVIRFTGGLDCSHVISSVHEPYTTSASHAPLPPSMVQLLLTPPHQFTHGLVPGTRHAPPPHATLKVPSAATWTSGVPAPVRSALK